MSVDKLIRIILDQKDSMEELFKRGKLVGREGLDEAASFLRSPNVLAVIGPRRSGKTVFSYMLAKKLSGKFLYINFFDERLSTLDNYDVILRAAYQLYGADLDLFIFDEIQELQGWERFVSRLRNNNRVIITGSNAGILGGELSVYLTGRYIKFFLLPFSFREVCGSKSDTRLSTKEESLILECFRKYLFSSGFPEYYLFGKMIVNQIFEDIIFKDCIYRYGIKNVRAFRELSSILVSQFSSQFNYRKLSNATGMPDINSVKNYVQFLEDSFLIFISYIFSKKPRTRYLTSKKVYVSDLGFANFSSVETAKKESRLLENLVAIELKRRGKELLFYKTKDGYEVDFVTGSKEGQVDELIQVSYAVDNEITKQREIRALLHARKELGITNLSVITYDYESVESVKWHRMEGKIKFLPAWKWLLQNK